MCLLFIPEFGDGRSHCKPSSRAQQGKNLPANAGDAGDRRRGFDPWVEKIPWNRKWQPTLVFLPEKSHGQRNLVRYNPWDCKRVGHSLVTKEQHGFS